MSGNYILKTTIVLFMSVFLSIVNVTANANNVTEDASEISMSEVNELKEDSDELSATDMVNEAIEAFQNKKGIEWGKPTKKGKIYYQATHMVDVDTTNPSWPKWRVTAYQKAFADIKEQFLQDHFGRLRGETVSKYFVDDSDNNRQFAKEKDPRATTRVGAIVDKAVALTGAKLDSFLSEYNIDPDKYNAAPKEKRKNIMKNSYINKTIQQASGGLSGLMSVKTFEGRDSSGRYSIGVIAMYYSKLRQLADDITKQRVPMLKKSKGYPVKDYMPKSKKGFSDTFGIRLIFDENGAPVIISYGQWSYTYKGKDANQIERGRQFAKKNASTEAAKQITEFLNSNASYQSLAEAGTNISIDVVKDRDGNVNDEKIHEMINKVTSEMKVTFSGSTTGMRTLKNWRYKHPSGHEIIGVVKAWSQANADSSSDVRNFKSKNVVSHPGSVKSTNQDVGKAGVSGGAGMDLDF